MKISYSTFSKTGKRHENQDVIKIFEDRDNGRYAFVLCDGMGGLSMGRMAAKIVATSIVREISGLEPNEEIDMASVISHTSMTFETMSEVYNDIKEGTTLGTTMVLAYIDGNTLAVAHCGDSRCYVYSKSKDPKYLTKDHCEDGDMDSPLTRCFVSGFPQKAQPDLMTIKIESGDRILLCSDGVYKWIYPDILRDRMMDNKPMESIMDTFEYLCELNSNDNYSAILVKVD